LSEGHFFHAFEHAAFSADVASHRFFLGGHRPVPSPSRPAGAVWGRTFEACVSYFTLGEI
jgi:hypothetical protein